MQVVASCLPTYLAGKKMTFEKKRKVHTTISNFQFASEMKHCFLCVEQVFKPNHYRPLQRRNLKVIFFDEPPFFSTSGPIFLEKHTLGYFSFLIKYSKIFLTFSRLSQLKLRHVLYGYAVTKIKDNSGNVSSLFFLLLLCTSIPL